MSAPKNSDPKKLYLSASRIDCFYECSQRYAARYIWKLPDSGNDGSNRGSTCHDTLELLLKPRHEKVYKAALEAGTCTKVPALWRLIKGFARKYGVADKANLELIDDFMMVALRNEFKGPAGTIQTYGEREFNLEIDEDGCRFNIRGKIDQTFIVRDGEGLIVSITDFKSSKTKFQDDKADFNIQSIIYQIALKYLHPEIKRRRFRFLFLKFPRKPWQEMKIMTDAQLEGYEWVLADLQEQMEKFTLKDADSNLAAHKEAYRWLCGKEGFKDDGTPHFICPARRPMDYWVVVNEEGKVVRSAMMEEELKIEKEGEKIEKWAYPGCPAYR